MLTLIAVSLSSGLMAFVVGYFIGNRAKDWALDHAVHMGVIDINGVRYVIYPAIWDTTLNENVAHTHDPSHTK